MWMVNVADSKGRLKPWMAGLMERVHGQARTKQQLLASLRGARNRELLGADALEPKRLKHKKFVR